MPKAIAQVEMLVSAEDSTRNRILAAAATLVAQLGWGSVRTRAVAERAGVNPALVHYHFGSMDALLREAVLARLQPELEMLARPLMEDMPFAEALRRTLQGVAHFDLESEAGVLLAEALLRATRDGLLAQAMGGEIRAWRRLVEPSLVRAQAAGEVRTDIATGTLAMIIVAALDGFVLQHMADADAEPDAVASALARLMSPARERRG